MESQTIAFKTAEIISNILLECESDSRLTEICLDDYGQCILTTLEGILNIDEIVKIGQEFGDSSPDIHPLNEKAIEIVFCNYKHEKITIPSITIKIEQTTEVYPPTNQKINE